MILVVRDTDAIYRCSFLRPHLHTHLTLVETVDPELMEELMADRRIGPQRAARLSDCVAIVSNPVLQEPDSPARTTE